MFRVACVATIVLETLISMPLLIELVSAEDSFCYRHGAPSGAVPALLHLITAKTAKNPSLHHKCLNRTSLSALHGSLAGAAPGCHRGSTVYSQLVHY